MPQNCTVCVLIPQQYLGLVFFLKGSVRMQLALQFPKVCMLFSCAQEEKHYIPVGKPLRSSLETYGVFKCI